MSNDYTDVIGEMRGMIRRAEAIRARYSNATTYAKRDNSFSRVASSLRSVIKDMEEEVSSR